MKPFIAIVAVAIAVAVGAVAYAQTPTDPEGVMRAAIDAFNAGDAEASAAFFSEDVTVTGLCPPANVCHGRAELQAFLEIEIAEGAQDEIRDLTVDGNTVVVQLTERVPAFAELGIERVYITLTATVEDGLITSMVDELDLSDPQTATFVQALEGGEEPALPDSGTGYEASVHDAPWWALVALVTLGAGLLTAGVGTFRKRA